MLIVISIIFVLFKYTKGTIVLAISLSFKKPQTIAIDFTAYSLTTVSSNPANYSNI